MAFDVFISYPHQDKAVADAACAKLEAAGVRCWIAPRDIAPSAEWAASIVEAIDQCKVMVLIFSSHSNQSRQVHREVQQAFDSEKPVVPFRIENVMPEKTLRYYMGSVHWLDALTPPLEQHLERLVVSVRALVGASAYELDWAGERKREAEAEQRREEAQAKRREQEVQRQANEERRRIAEAEAERERDEEEGRKREEARRRDEAAARDRAAEVKRRREAQGEYLTEQISDASAARDHSDLPRRNLFLHALRILWPEGWAGRAASLGAIASVCLITIWLDWNGWFSFPVLTLTGQSGNVTSVAFSPDGKWLASNGYLMFWDTTTGAKTTVDSSTGGSLYAATIAFSPDGKWLAAVDNSRSAISLVAPGSSDVTRNIQMPAQMGSIAFSPDSKLIATGNGSIFDFGFENKTGLVSLWEVATGRAVRAIAAKAPVSSVAFSPDGKWIVSGSDVATDVWDTETGQLVRQVQDFDSALRSVIFSPDGKSVATGSLGKLKIWDVVTGKKTREFDIGNSYVSSIAFSPDSKLVAAGTTGTVNIWDAATGAAIAIFRPHSCCVYSVAYSADGKWIASGGDLGTVKIWRAP